MDADVWKTPDGKRQPGADEVPGVITATKNHVWCMCGAT
jgi:hypothetical protein